MASSNSSTGPDQGLPPVRSARRAAQQQAGQPSDDPEVLASEIEKTREDLAETLDAIADKVSPKRVTQRTKKKVANTAKQGAHDAADTVKEKAAVAGETLKDAAEALKEKAVGAGESLREVAPDTSSGASAGVPDVDGSMASIEASGQSETEFAIDAVPSKPGAVAVTPDVQRPSVAPVTGDLKTDDPPSLKPGGQPTSLAPVAQSRGPVLAGAAAAVAVLLLLLRRRRR